MPGNQVTAAGPFNIKTAWKIIALLIFVVIFNLGLYAGILIAARNDLFNSESSFPALILFLSFALSIAVIILVALGERVTTENVENDFIKKFGVAPTLIIVAVLLSLLTTITPLASNILPKGAVAPRFMVANIGVSCQAADPSNSPQATKLLAVISSPDEDYIEDVRKFITDQQNKPYFKNPEFTLVQAKGKSDDIYTLIWEHRKSNEPWARTLVEDVSKDKKWLAYTVEMGDPRRITSIPIPTRYEKNHKSSLFVITTEPEKRSLDPLQAAVKPIQDVAYSGLKLNPLLQVEIFSKLATPFSQLTSLDTKVFANFICWHIAGG